MTMTEVGGSCVSLARTRTKLVQRQRPWLVRTVIRASCPRQLGFGSHSIPYKDILLISATNSIQAGLETERSTQIMSSRYSSTSQRSRTPSRLTTSNFHEPQSRSASRRSTMVSPKGTQYPQHGTSWLRASSLRPEDSASNIPSRNMSYARRTTSRSSESYRNPYPSQNAPRSSQARYIDQYAFETVNTTSPKSHIHPAAFHVPAVKPLQDHAHPGSQIQTCRMTLRSGSQAITSASEVSVTPATAEVATGPLPECCTKLRRTDLNQGGTRHLGHG